MRNNLFKWKATIDITRRNFTTRDMRDAQPATLKQCELPLYG